MFASTTLFRMMVTAAVCALLLFSLSPSAVAGYPPPAMGGTTPSTTPPPTTPPGGYYHNHGFHGNVTFFANPYLQNSLYYGGFTPSFYGSPSFISNADPYGCGAAGNFVNPSLGFHLEAINGQLVAVPNNSTYAPANLGNFAVYNNSYNGNFAYHAGHWVFLNGHWVWRH